MCNPCCRGFYQPRVAVPLFVPAAPIGVVPVQSRWGFRNLFGIRPRAHHQPVRSPILGHRGHSVASPVLVGQAGVRNPGVSHIAAARFSAPMPTMRGATLLAAGRVVPQQRRG